MWRVSLLVVLAALLLSVAQAGAAPVPMRQALDTPTPTPAYQTVATLTSGGEVVYSNTWTAGELANFLAILCGIALYGLRWISELARKRSA